MARDGEGEKVTGRRRFAPMASGGRIESAIRAAHAEGRCALICYLTGGDPSLEVTEALVCAIADAGADVVELGIPFSDPVADGPTIQASSHRALAGGTDVRGILQCIANVRSRCSVPIVAMSYLNPILSFGLDRFAETGSEVGLDGVIMTDLPAEESNEWIATARRSHLDTIMLVTPTSTPERLRASAKRATGFLYCVSRLGVTGTSQNVSRDATELLERARSVARCPVCLGFGISSPEHVRQLANVSDGLVVGSALVAAVADQTTLEKKTEAAYALVADLRHATSRSR